MPHAAICSCLPRRGVLALAALAASAPAAFSQSLFVINATGGGNDVTVGADSLLDLVDNAVNTQDQFAPFANVDANFSLNYGGVANAITITKNSANTGASLTFGPTGVTRNFTGTSQADLENQIEEYLKSEGGSDLADFFSAMNAQSVIAVSDGNPNSTTARMANWSFDHFGLYAANPPSRRDGVGGLAPAGVEAEQTTDPAPQGGGDDAPPANQRTFAGFLVSIGAASGTFEAGDFDGQSATVFGEATLNFSQRVGLSLGSFIAYNTIGDADVFHGGVTAGLPIRFILPDDATPWAWQVTPFIQVGASASEDIGAGGLIYGGGAASNLTYFLNNRWSLSMANQFSRFEGETLSFEGYEIDPGVSQGMMKHALRANVTLGETWHAFGGVGYSQYLDDAAVESWISPVVGLGSTTPAGSGIQASVSGDFGDDYQAFALRLSGRLAF